MAEHTAGPWWFEAEAYGNFAILANQGPLEVCPAHVHSLGDARLIAEAPMMLAALEAAAPLIDIAERTNYMTPELWQACERIRATIAKAKGEAR